MKKSEVSSPSEMHSIAPGKIILTGEHAVVYGKPAFVMAVNRYANSTITKNSSSTLQFNINHNSRPLNLTFTFAEVPQLYEQIKKRYNLFLDNHLPIQRVMERSIDIIPFAFYLVVQENNINLVDGLDIRINIDIPFGCGMGSSASTALSVLQATASYYQIKLTQDDYFEYAMQCEKLCHGTPSGIDPYISLHGGFMRFQNGQSEQLPLPEFRFFLALTGKPVSSTGECVINVRERFAKSIIWDEFESIAEDFQNALKHNDLVSICAAVQKNHQLLSNIGVVPEKVKKFIADIEKQNGAAKISGAGSIAGDSAGIVLLFCDSHPLDLCRRYNYELLQVESDANGLRLL